MLIRTCLEQPLPEAVAVKSRRWHRRSRSPKCIRQMRGRRSEIFR